MLSGMINDAGYKMQDIGCGINDTGFTPSCILHPETSRAVVIDSREGAGRSLEQLAVPL
jgi:hypothetical protein